MFSFKETSYFLILLFFLVLPISVFAQASSGVGLKPALIEVGANPGDVLQKNISISNLSPVQQTYYLSTRDIRTVREGGTPVYADPNTEKTGFELSEWIQLGKIEVTLEADEEVTIPVTINIPDSATPGSHFGGIFVSLKPPKFREVGASVGYEVANIVSIRIAGDVNENAIVRSFRTDKLIYGQTDINFYGEIENKGNVLIRPYGPVEVYNMFGKKVTSMILNDSQGGVFPFTKREFTINWKDEGIGFGRYQAILSMLYGETGRQATISSTVSFWILPMNIITPALIILAILLLTSYFGVKMYIRRTIATMSGGRRLVRQKRRKRGTSTLLLVAIVMLCVTAVFLIFLLILFA